MEAAAKTAPPIPGDDAPDNPDVRSGSSKVSDPRTEAVRAVAKGSDDPLAHKDALAWFLSDQDSGDVATETFELNVGLNEERWIEWTVQAIPREEIRQIRRMSMTARQRAQGGNDFDEIKVNLGIAASGTRSPDLKEVATAIGADPMTALRERMKHKPGLIDQIASRVLTVSGYDDEDVRDVGAVRNS